MKVSGPLQSEEAHGTVANFLTFSKRKTGQQARYQNKQKDANSSDQQIQRAKFLNASIACLKMEYGIITIGSALYGNNKAIDTELIAGKAVTEYNNCIAVILNNNIM